MKRLKSVILTAVVMTSSFLTAYAFTPEVNCDTESRMFGESLCIDEYGNYKVCKHTFWVTHTCRSFYGPITEEDNGE